MSTTASLAGTATEIAASPRTERHDDWRLGHVGFRADWLVGGDDTDFVTFQGDLYSGQMGDMVSPLPIPVPPFTTSLVDQAEATEGDFLWKWTHTIDEQSNYWLQAYYDRTNRNEVGLNQALDTYDVQFQYHFVPLEWHALTWGLSYRMLSDASLSNGSYWLRLDPDSRTTSSYATFLQDQIALTDQLAMYVGSKFEHNDYTGFECEPSVRLLYAIDPRHVVWTAVSRAVRTPSRIETDSHYRFVIASAAFRELVGNRSLQAEDLLAYEAGYRAQETDAFSWDLAVFYNDYGNLVGLQPHRASSGLSADAAVPVRKCRQRVSLWVRDHGAMSIARVVASIRLVLVSATANRRCGLGFTKAD